MPAGGMVPPAPSGKSAVDRSLEAKKLKEADAARGDEPGGEAGRKIEDVVRRIDGKTFYLRDGVWMDADAPKDAARRRVVRTATSTWSWRRRTGCWPRPSPSGASS